MLMTVEETKKKIQDGLLLSLAGDENLLRELPSGKWIGGTIPYFMDSAGGTISKEKVYVDEIPGFGENVVIKSYDVTELPGIPSDAPENGFSLIIIPATSDAHLTFAQNAPNFKDIFMKPLIGWISGVHLDDLGKISPKVFNGAQSEVTDKKAVVMHVTIPSDKLASIGIVNLFTQGSQDTITFEETGFSAKDCYINGQKRNFAEYLLENKTDTRLPLVSNYFGAMVNVSFQNIDRQTKTVNFYAPVFKQVAYKHAAPVKDYVSEFQGKLPKEMTNVLFSCNCILNFLYSELEGKKTEGMVGPITFGEIAYQLLNQTLVYLDIKEA